MHNAGVLFSVCVTICVAREKRNLRRPVVQPWPDSCSDKQVTSFPGEKARQQWEGDEEDSVPLHSYQFSALIRLDWITGMSQVGTV